jgi:chloride channel 2
MRKIDWTQMYWLIILSVSASISALIVDESVLAINTYKKQVKSFVFICLLSMLLAGLACYIMKYVSAQATGSGIPQMKAIMAGLTLPNMLSFRTYLAKCSGMICMLGTGLSLGKEGPFVHISGCIAESLPYRELASNKTLRHQFLTAAVAVGVSCTFGAPIGGVLFAVEVSTLHFSVSNLWKAFFCSTISVLCFKFFGSLGTAATFTADASYFYQGD